MELHLLTFLKKNPKLIRKQTHSNSHKIENRHSSSIHLNLIEDFELHTGFWYFKKQYLHEESIMPKTRK